MNFLIGLLVAALAVAPTFPWQTYPEIPSVAPMGPACNGAAEVYQISDEWRTLSSATRDVFVHFTDGVPDFVYFTEGTASGQRISVKRVWTIEEAQQKLPDPCAWFTEISA